MYPQEEIDGFERYWRRRKPGRSTAIHYRSDVNIFFRWVKQLPATITIHHIDQFIDWQRELGRASATIQRRLVAIRMFFDYLAYIREEDMSNPVLPRRHYITPGRHLPRNLPDDVIAKLFAAPAPSLSRLPVWASLWQALRDHGSPQQAKSSALRWLEGRDASLINYLMLAVTPRSKLTLSCGARGS
ncbi:MAG: site-specific integrase [Anaerolineae bacterium]|jgi:site-specific recombinase XerD